MTAPLSWLEPDCDVHIVDAQSPPRGSITLAAVKAHRERRARWSPRPTGSSVANSSRFTPTEYPYCSAPACLTQSTNDGSHPKCFPKHLQNKIAYSVDLKRGNRCSMNAKRCSRKAPGKSQSGRPRLLPSRTGCRRRSGSVLIWQESTIPRTTEARSLLRNMRISRPELRWPEERVALAQERLLLRRELRFCQNSPVWPAHTQECSWNRRAIQNATL